MGQVREVMSTRLHTVEPADTVGEAVAVMAQHRVGSVLIMEGDRLLGEISFTQPTVEGAAVLRSVGEWHAIEGIPT